MKNPSQTILGLAGLRVKIAFLSVCGLGGTDLSDSPEAGLARAQDVRTSLGFTCRANLDTSREQFKKKRVTCRTDEDSVVC